MEFNSNPAPEINKIPFVLPDINFKDKTTTSGDNISTDSKTSKIKWLEKEETSQIDIEEIDDDSCPSDDDYDRKAFFEYKQHEFLNGNEVIKRIKGNIPLIFTKSNL